MSEALHRMIEQQEAELRRLRSRLDDMSAYVDELEREMDQGDAVIERLNRDIGRTLSKGTREMARDRGWTP